MCSPATLFLFQHADLKIAKPRYSILLPDQLPSSRPPGNMDIINCLGQRDPQCSHRWSPRLTGVRLWKRDSRTQCSMGFLCKLISTTLITLGELSGRNEKAESVRTVSSSLAVKLAWTYACHFVCWDHHRRLGGGNIKASNIPFAWSYHKRCVTDSGRRCVQITRNDLVDVDYSGIKRN